MKTILAALALALVTSVASAQSSGTAQPYARGYWKQSGGAVVRIGNEVRIYDSNRRLLARGTKRGDVVNMYVTDGTRLKINYSTKRIYDAQGRGIAIARDLP